MAGFTVQPLVVQEGEGAGTFAMPVRLVNEDGTPYAASGSGSAYVLPAATQNALGGVKLQVFGTAIGNATTNVAAAAGDAPTKAEYDALKDAYNALASQFNRLISGLSTSGVIQVPSGSQEDQ